MSWRGAWFRPHTTLAFRRLLLGFGVHSGNSCSRTRFSDRPPQPALNNRVFNREQCKGKDCYDNAHEKLPNPRPCCGINIEHAEDSQFANVEGKSIQRIVHETVFANGSKHAIMGHRCTESDGSYQSGDCSENRLKCGDRRCAEAIDNREYREQGRTQEKEDGSLSTRENDQCTFERVTKTHITEDLNAAVELERELWKR